MKDLRPMHITHPHLSEMIPSNEIKHHPEPSTSLKVMDESLESTNHLTQLMSNSDKSQIKRNNQSSQKMAIRNSALSELSEIDFEKFYNNNNNK